MKSAPSIAFDFRPSRVIAAAVVAVSLAAALAPWQCRLPTIAEIALSIAVCVVALTSLRNFRNGPVRKIAYRAAGWTMVDAGEIERPVELSAHLRIGSWIALTLRDADRRVFRAWLGPDNLDPDTRRRLIVLLSRAEVAQTG